MNIYEIEKPERKEKRKTWWYIRCKFRKKNRVLCRYSIFKRFSNHVSIHESLHSNETFTFKNNIVEFI